MSKLKRKLFLSVICGIAAIATVQPALAQAEVSNSATHRIKTITIPGNPLKSFDISTMASHGSLFAFSDRSNHAVDLIDAQTDRYIGRVKGFTGTSIKGEPGTAGPDGLVAVGQKQIWAGNGDSTVKIINLKAKRVVATVSTGGKNRVDEMTYDPRDHMVITANNADTPAFLTFISTRPGHRVLAHLKFPQATAGLEQPLWDPTNDRIYLSVPEVDGVKAHGAIAEVSATSHQLIRMIRVNKCMPAGLARGPNNQILVGCSDDGVAAGFAPKSLILNTRTGKIASSIPQVGGSDEVCFDRASDQYYLAAAANTGGPVLGVINAKNDRWVRNVATGPKAHSVASDAKTQQVFMPIAAGQSNGACQSGCVAVYAAK